MSTRAMLTFEGTGIKIYKHSDGYPSGVLPVLLPFVKDFVGERGHDPGYLTAQVIRAFFISEDERRKETLARYQEKAQEDPYFERMVEHYSKPNLTLGWGISTRYYGGLEFIYHVTKDGAVEVYETTPEFESDKHGSIDQCKLLQRFEYPKDDATALANLEKESLLEVG